MDDEGNIKIPWNSAFCHMREREREKRSGLKSRSRDPHLLQTTTRLSKVILASDRLRGRGSFSRILKNKKS
jgi:hypothetical protein